MRLNRSLFIVGHQGLGDHILCAGIYNFKALQAKRVYIFVKSNYVKDVKRLLANRRKAIVIPVPRKKFWIYLKVIIAVSKAARSNLLLLGFFGGVYLQESIRFDECFYLQAKVPFDYRWESFYMRSKNSDQLLKELNLNLEEGEEYIFLHEDRTRGFTIDREKLPKGLRIIEPLPPTRRWSALDYVEVIKCAKEIHVIESSFAALIESLQIMEPPKFAHRYARPNALYDQRYEFTYRSYWTVLT